MTPAEAQAATAGEVLRELQRSALQVYWLAAVLEREVSSASKAGLVRLRRWLRQYLEGTAAVHHAHELGRKREAAELHAALPALPGELEELLAEVAGAGWPDLFDAPPEPLGPAEVPRVLEAFDRAVVRGDLAAAAEAVRRAGAEA